MAQSLNLASFQRSTITPVFSEVFIDQSRSTVVGTHAFRFESLLANTCTCELACCEDEANGLVSLRVARGDRELVPCGARA